MNITGVTMNWVGQPCLEFDGHYVLPRKAEKLLYGDFYKNEGEWPRYPDTGEKVPMSTNMEEG